MTALLAFAVGVLLISVAVQRIEIAKLRAVMGTPPAVRIHRTPEGDWNIVVRDDVTADKLDDLAEFLDYLETLELP